MLELIEIAERAAEAAYVAEIDNVTAIRAGQPVPGDGRAGDVLRELAQAREHLARAGRLVRRMGAAR